MVVVHPPPSKIDPGSPVIKDPQSQQSGHASNLTEIKKERRGEAIV